MLLRGISTLVNLKREINVTEQELDKFIEAVLTNEPFIQTYSIGTLKIVCQSPNSKDYEELGALSNKDEFEYAVIKAVLKEVSINDTIIYEKNDTCTDWKTYFADTIGKSPLQILVLEKVVYFYNLFVKLLQELLAPDFFGKTKHTGRS